MTASALRLDKWLWYARFCKSRSLASRLCAAGRVRIDGTVITKAHHKVRIGEVITFPQGRLIRVVQVLALATRRGPAAEARLLYADLKPPNPASRQALPATPPRPEGRPDRRDRRALRRLKVAD